MDIKGKMAAIVPELFPIIGVDGKERRVGEAFEHPIDKAKKLVASGKARWPEPGEEIESDPVVTFSEPIIPDYEVDNETSE